MLLHFEDWTTPMFLRQVESRGLPHAGKIIKVFATEEDPRIAIEKPGLTVIEANVQPFDDTETFTYPGRPSFSGVQLEQDLYKSGLNELGVCSVRGLFRFANTHGFCQAAMAARNNNGDDWLVDHPMQDIDGISRAITNPERAYVIHLDIFFPESVAVLKDVVDYTDPTAVLGMMEYARWRRGQARSVPS